MYHSISIAAIPPEGLGELYTAMNTWADWKLIPSSRPFVEMPPPKTEYVDLPGRLLPLDLSEALVGHLLYGTRTGEWEFYVTNDYPGYNWATLRDSMASYIHGKRHRVILEDDPFWYYEGRLTFDWETGSNWSMVNIGYDLGPFKRELILPAAYQNIRVSDSTNVSVIGYDEYSVPTIIVNSDDGTGLYLAFQDEYVHLSDGENKDPRIEINPGTNKLTFYGNGVVTINYRGGRL